MGCSAAPSPPSTHHFDQAPGLPVIVVQSTPGHTAPNRPDSSSQHMHLDFGVDDLATADRTATDAGATGCRAGTCRGPAAEAGPDPGGREYPARRAPQPRPAGRRRPPATVCAFPRAWPDKG
ncbi:VOC family protein [Streptomyces sp. NPDC021969]|uniref:VOC family protein n=1 Tax=unclassified Streptomyces TaxID=2593676 RepID=UPI0033C871D0